MFDWDWTDREVIVMCPYYGDRYDLSKFAVENFHSEIDQSKWGLMLLDDGWGQDWSELEEQFPYFRALQIRRTGSPIRGGQFARNVFLKRTKSKWVGFKDPECVIQGDFIKAILESDSRSIVRPSGIHVLNEKASSEVTSNKLILEEVKYKSVSFQQLRIHKYDTNIVLDDNHKKFHTRKTGYGAHYGSALMKEHLINIGGYDERASKNAGWLHGQGEEFALFRLLHVGLSWKWVDECSVYHLWHSRNDCDKRRSIGFSKLKKMKAVRGSFPFVLNPNGSENLAWGEQYDKEVLDKQ